MTEGGSEGPFDQSPIGDMTTTSDGLVLTANRTLLRWLAMDLADVRGLHIAELLAPASQLYYETQYRAVLQLHGRVESVTLDLRTADGADFPVLVAAEQRARPGAEPVVRVSLFPARARAAYERELRRSRTEARRSAERLRLLHDLREALRSALQPGEVADALDRGLESHVAGALVATWLVQDDGELRLERGAATPFSPATVARDADLPPAAVARTATARSLRLPELQKSWPALTEPLAAADRTVLVVVPLVAEDDVLGVVQVALRRDRETVLDDPAVLATLGSEGGQALLRCELPAHLQGLPLRDALTGTATPALFGERVGAALARAAASDAPLALLLLEIVPGVLTGEQTVDDEVVAELGARLRSVADSSARVGGQRFAVLREHCSVGEARHWAAALQQVLAKPDHVDQQVSVTIGGVVVEPALDGRSVTVRAVLVWAATALATAAARGPGRREVQGAGDRRTARAVVSAERMVRRALRDDDVVMHYQPVVHLRTGRVVGAEALCRLRLPDGSLLQPSHFIDAAEDSGLLIPLGRQALEVACQQQATWAAEGKQLDVAVNVAASQIADPDFAASVQEVLTTTGCDPEHLVLELTESALLTATSVTLGWFEALRMQGVRVALDDFGTRYASLDYVRSFPLDELKIDQSFVAGLPSSRVARAIVRMVAQLAAELDLACVAEGIETAGQAQYLRDLGVLGQGFAIGHPAPAEDLTAWRIPASWITGEDPWESDAQDGRS